MLDELQAEAPDYEIDPLNYLLSAGQSLEEIEQYRKDGIKREYFPTIKKGENFPTTKKIPT